MSIDHENLFEDAPAWKKEHPTVLTICNYKKNNNPFKDAMQTS